MQIDRLELEGFRNYVSQCVAFDPRCNVIVGENAQGKTNLLEALVYLSCGRSPRARTDREMIGFQAASARLRAAVFARERAFQVQIDLFRDRRRKMSVNQVPAKTAAELSTVYQTVFFRPEDLFLIREGAAARRRFMDRRRKMSVNQVPAKTAAELSTVYQTVFFRPEDLFLIREGAAARRRFMDTALCQLRPRYATALAAYHRIYEHKTRILRDAEERPDLLTALPEFNEQMVRFGAVVIHYRHQFALRLEEYAALHHRECSGGRETLTIRYQTVSGVSDPGAALEVLTEQLRCHMESHQAAERASRSCLSGPHKDDLLVSIDGRDAKSFASQGQTRTAALAMKLAEREIYKNATGEYPVLLLDDVLSELDPRRQEFVLNRIAGGQVFITCCEEDRLPQLLGGRVFRVVQGGIC